jgi:hypothetical protein
MRQRWLPGLVLLALGLCACTHEPVELPQPVLKWPAPPEIALPSPPRMAEPPPPVVLSRQERVAIEQLRRRGVYVDVSDSAGEMLVHFPLGALERQWKKEGKRPMFCGQGIAYSFSPDVDGPPMTDRDVRYLDRLPRLKRVNLAGTRVTPRAIAAFRASHPDVAVEDKDDE